MNVEAYRRAGPAERRVMMTLAVLQAASPVIGIGLCALAIWAGWL